MSDIRETIINITKNVTKTSSDLLKTTKLGINLSAEETSLKNLYIEIGKKVHEIYQYGGSLGKFFDEKYYELEACERKIAELKEEISQIKGTRECKCGKMVDRTSEFCPKCGIRLTEAMSSVVPETHHVADYIAPAPVAPHIEPTTHIPASAMFPASSALPPHPEPIAPTMPPQPVTTYSVEQPLTKTCRVCGVANEIVSKFCLSCGRILE